MLKTTLSRELKMFFGYFLGYSLLFFPILFFIFNGRALAAEAAYRMGKIRSMVFVATPRLGSGQGDVAGDLREIPQSVSPSAPDTAVRNLFPTGQAGIVIPKIGAEAPIVFSRNSDNKSILQDLRFGVSRYPESADFGERGATILLGHSSAYPTYRGNYGSVFALLNKLEAGDEFFVFDGGKQYTYRVQNTKVVLPKDFRVEGLDDGSYIVLMSCWPVGTNWRRIVILSKLMEQI